MCQLLQYKNAARNSRQLPYFFGSVFISGSSLTSVGGAASTLVGGTSTVTACCEATRAGDGKLDDDGDRILEPDGVVGGNGKGDPWGKGALLNWPFCGAA